MKFDMQLARFGQAADQSPPARAVLVCGTQWRQPQRRLYALVLTHRLHLEHFPELECMTVTAVPLLFFDAGQSAPGKAHGTAIEYGQNRRFFLLADRSLGKCRFGPPDGRLVLDAPLRSFGLGSYMLSRLIAWGKANFPGSAVTIENIDLSLLGGEAALVNGFCRRAGFDVIFHGGPQATCLVKRMELLQEDYNQDRLGELEEDFPADWLFPALRTDLFVDHVRRRHLA